MIQRQSYDKNLIFVPEKESESFFFVYILEFMLTLAKMQNSSLLMCEKFEI